MIDWDDEIEHDDISMWWFGLYVAPLFILLIIGIFAGA